MKMEKELSFGHYLECIKKMDNFCKMLRSMFCKESTLYEVDCSKTKEEEYDVPEVGDQYRIKPFSCIAGDACVRRENYPIETCMHPIHCAQQRLTIIDLVYVLENTFKA